MRHPAAVTHLLLKRRDPGLHLGNAHGHDFHPSLLVEPLELLDVLGQTWTRDDLGKRVGEDRVEEQAKVAEPRAGRVGDRGRE